MHSNPQNGYARLDESGGAGDLEDVRIQFNDTTGSSGFLVNFIGVDSTRRTDFACEPGWTVAQLKDAAFPAEMAAGKNVRLIYNGRVMPAEDTLTSLGVESGCFLHFSVADKIGRSGTNASGLQRSDEDGGDVHGDAYLAWQQYQLNQDEQAMNFETPEGTTGDLALGFFIGFFIGIFAVFWIMQRRVPRRQKAGIIFGIMGNFIWGAFRFHTVDTSGSPGTGANSSHSGNANQSAFGIPVQGGVP